MIAMYSTPLNFILMEIQASTHTLATLIVKTYFMSFLLSMI